MFLLGYTMKEVKNDVMAALNGSLRRAMAESSKESGAAGWCFVWGTLLVACEVALVKVCLVVLLQQLSVHSLTKPCVSCFLKYIFSKCHYCRL